MIKVVRSSVVIDLGANTEEDKMIVVGELAVAVKGVSETVGMKPNKLLKLIKSSIEEMDNIVGGDEDVKED